MAEGIEKRSERDTPELVAIRAVGEKAEVLEERVHVAAVGGRGSGDGTVRGTLETLDGLGIHGELAVRQVRSGRVPVEPDWGRPESVRREFRERFAQ